MKMIRVVKSAFNLGFVNLNEAFDNFEEIYVDDELLQEAKGLDIFTDEQIEQIKNDNKSSLQNGVYQIEGGYFNDNFEYDKMVKFKELMNEPV